MLSQVASVLKEDFSQFMPDIMASLMRDIEEDVQIKFVKQEEAELEEAANEDASNSNI
jgi:hypothetical protein